MSNPAGNISDLEFLKGIFNLRDKNVEWAVVIERSDGGSRPRLGLWIEGSTKYVDVAQRIFNQKGSVAFVDNCVFPAYCIEDGDELIFQAKDEPELSLTLPDTFVMDIYFRTWYSEELERQPLI